MHDSLKVPGPLVTQLMSRFQSVINSGKYSYPIMKSAFYFDVFSAAKSISVDFIKVYCGDNAQSVLVDCALPDDRLGFLVLHEFDLVKDRDGDFLGIDGYQMLRLKTVQDMHWKIVIQRSRDWDDSASPDAKKDIIRQAIEDLDPDIYKQITK